jgi:hypothetical protein
VVFQFNLRNACVVFQVPGGGFGAPDLQAKGGLRLRCLQVRCSGVLVFTDGMHGTGIVEAHQ